MIITRYHNTTSLQLTVEFLTPTFLGGADQHAELRAAPFKNLLRQWWRVVSGGKYGNHQEMLSAEGDLFGSVRDENQSNSSKVRLAKEERLAAARLAIENQSNSSKVRLALTPVEGMFNLAENEFDFGKTKQP